MSGIPLSSRERVRLALEHKETDRVPIAMICAGINEPARTAYRDYLKQRCGTDLDEYLDSLIDTRNIAPAYIGSGLEPGQDIWGVVREPVSYGAGAYDEIYHYPLADAADVADLAKHSWPTTQLFDYSVLPERARALQQGQERCLMIANGNIFETSWYMRGFENMFLDMVMNPEFVHALMARVTDYYVEHFTRMLAAAEGMIDLAFTADDLGGQNGLLMSLEMWEQFIKPYHARLNKAIHEFGVRVIYHSDGGVAKVVPGLIDMGIDVLQALQFDAAGMDPVELKKNHGHELCFEGGVSVQKTLPFGTVEEVRQEVERLISVLGKDGGYILGPSHAIQAGTPPENIFTMFDTAQHYYPFS